MATRHARRIYAGGIPPKATEDEILKFFNGVVRRALYPTIPRSDPVIKIYLNTEKCYAFVEFDSIELTTACMQLDGLKFDHYTGTTIIRVRRPNDYRPDMLPPSSEQIPDLNLDVLGGMGCTVSSGPGKVFIGGLPYNLADEQVKELLTAFGSIKAFHQVRDPGSVTTKGYAFCEYVDQETADAAIAGLNGLKIGDKTLNVRRATATSMPSTGPPVFNIGTSAFGMDMALPTTNPLLNIGSNPLLPYGSGVYGAGGGSTSQSSIASYPPTRVSECILRCDNEYQINLLLFYCFRS